MLNKFIAFLLFVLMIVVFITSLDLETKVEKLEREKEELTVFIEEVNNERNDEKSIVENQEEVIFNLYQKNNQLFERLEEKEKTKEELELELEEALQLLEKTKASLEEVEIYSEETNAISRSSYSESELEMLSKMINAEATGWPESEKMAVGQVILNRKNHFNLTLKQAIFEKSSSGVYVFSPLIDGRYYSVPVVDLSILVAKRLLLGEVYYPVGNALYFCTHASYNSGGWHWQYVNNSEGQIIYKSECHVYIR